jgi:hypothetical protein
MAATTIKQQIIEQLDALTEEQQKRVLAFTASLVRPRGEPGSLLLERTRDIHIAPDDLEKMKQVIEEDCERIDWDEWDLPA